MENFGSSDRQSSSYIMDMRLRRPTGLERAKLEEEYEELIKEINRFREILANEND